VNDMLISAYVRAYGLRDSVIGALRRGVEAMQPESGQDFVEYAVLVGTIGIVAAVALIATDGGAWLTDALDSFKTQITDCITFSSTCGGG